MKQELVARATAAAAELAADLGLRVDDVVLVRSSNKLALRLLPCDVFARVGPPGHEVAALEIALAQRLTATGSPVAALEPRVEPRVYERDGFTVTWWTYYDTVARDLGSPGDYAQALHRLHLGLRTIEIRAPHLSDRAADAQRLVASPNDTPALTVADRQLLLSTLQDSCERIMDNSAAEQLLHGEPHPDNLLRTQDGPRFVDFETCCRGPVEFDVAHAPDDVGAQYPDVDHGLLAECRRLVLAMVAAWRWDVRDEFPDGLRHGRDIVALLRQGPPWPALGPLIPS